MIKDIDQVIKELVKLREEVHDLLRANHEMKNILDGVHNRPLTVESVKLKKVKPTDELVDDLIEAQGDYMYLG